jgi:hypothetical protein
VRIDWPRMVVTVGLGLVVGFAFASLGAACQRAASQVATAGGDPADSWVEVPLPGGWDAGGGGR